MVVEELLHEAGLAWCSGCRPGHVGGCLFLGGVPGLPRQIAGQPQLLPHLADDGVTDRSFHPGSRPRLVHGFGVGLGIALRNSLTKLVLPGAAVAVVAIVESPGWFKLRPVSTGDGSIAATWSTKFTRTSRESRVFGWLTASRLRCILSVTLGLSSDGSEYGGRRK